MASVEVQRRPGGLTDHFRSYEVFIDGNVVGSVQPGDSLTREVPPGSHEVFLKVDWCRSEKLKVHLRSGETAKFRCVAQANILTGFYWITFGRHRYINLMQVTQY